MQDFRQQLKEKIDTEYALYIHELHNLRYDELIEQAPIIAASQIIRNLILEDKLDIEDHHRQYLLNVDRPLSLMANSFEYIDSCEGSCPAISGIWKKQKIGAITRK